MNTSLSFGTSRPWENLGLEIRRRSARALKGLGQFFSPAMAEWMAKRDLKRQKTQGCETSYEAQKRRLLIALRRKISEKQTKNTTVEEQCSI
jgi:hypothetical protein